MPDAIPDKVKKEITAESLKDYDESLNSLVTKYSNNNK